ncbi:MAG: hypothetical protein GEV11_19285 [Streptosporangiales bacterium]|nr:hypothetical protein [Streptosporangiales bacterium]
MFSDLSWSVVLAEPGRSFLLHGLWVTVQLATLAIAGSTVLGTLVALGRVSTSPGLAPLRWLLAAYVEFLKVGKLPHVEKIVQIGSRGMRAAQDDLAESRANGNDVFTMKGFRRAGLEQVLATIPAGRKVYVSVDIDVLDMPLVPGCASAEADGMSYEELRQTIFGIVREHELVGFDVVEINMTSQLGAQLAIEAMARAVENPDYLRRKGRLTAAG